MQHYVVGFLFNPEKTKVVLIKKIKPDWQAGKLNGMGGSIERGEKPKQAMVREFLEETGVRTELDLWDHFFTMVLPDATVYFFRAFHEAFGTVETVTEEEIFVVDLASLSQVSNVIDNLRWIIPLAISADCGEMTMGKPFSHCGLMPRAQHFGMKQQLEVMASKVEEDVKVWGVDKVDKCSADSGVLRRILKFIAGPKTKN